MLTEMCSRFVRTKNNEADTIVLLIRNKKVPVLGRRTPTGSFGIDKKGPSESPLF